jgi:hypothetical protein
MVAPRMAPMVLVLAGAGLVATTSVACSDGTTPDCDASSCLIVPPDDDGSAPAEAGDDGAGDVDAAAAE